MIERPIRLMRRARCCRRACPRTSYSWKCRESSASLPPATVSGAIAAALALSRQQLAQSLHGGHELRAVEHVPLAGVGERDVNDLLDRPRPGTHDDDPVRQEGGFLQVMGD